MKLSSLGTHFFIIFENGFNHKSKMMHLLRFSMLTNLKMALTKPQLTATINSVNIITAGQWPHKKSGSYGSPPFLWRTWFLLELTYSTVRYTLKYIDANLRPIK